MYKTESAEPFLTSISFMVLSNILSYFLIWVTFQEKKWQRAPLDLVEASDTKFTESWTAQK